MKIKVALLSAGLGNISRGFETSTFIWFQEISNKEEIECKLFSGGKQANSTRVWNFGRNGKVAKLLRKLKIINDGCKFEQVTFSLGFLLHLFLYKPAVIWLQEGILASMLLTFRKLFGFRFKIIFCDGAPVGHNFSNKFDYIIFLQQYAYDEAIDAGINPKKCRVITHLTEQPKKQIDKGLARQLLSLNPNKFIIICVAAWNKHHKRIDYLLNEVATVNIKDITILLCGQPDLDTAELKDMSEKLNLDVRWHTFTQKELSVAYSASDIFILPSISEALGAVLIEAAFHKLPIICHPHSGGQHILGENYHGLTDLSKKGNLSKKIEEYKELNNLLDEGLATEQIVLKKFNRNEQVNSLIDLIVYAANN